MSIKNTTDQFGWLSIVLHWLMAIGLLGVYFSGIYMVDLDYYDAWYNRAPDLHKAVAIILAAMLVFRVVWIYSHHKPEPIEQRAVFRALAKLAHITLYILILLLMLSGYLISTSKGQGIQVFNLFELPASLLLNSVNSELLGQAHDLLASLFIAMTALHVTASLVHHFIFKDNTLKRILWVKKTVKLGDKQ